MNLLCSLALLAWVPFVFVLFAVFKPNRACALAIILGWLFLPNVQIPLPGLPDVEKAMWTILVCFVALLILAPGQLGKARLELVDGFAVVASIAPGLASIANDLGLYDAASAVFRQSLLWLAPYWMGRLCSEKREDLLWLCRAIVVGGLLYIPFCLFEIRMSPQLHLMVYGIPNQWLGARLGGWRPAVFMWNGLMLGLWMSAATFVAFWMWWKLPNLRNMGLRIGWIFTTLLVVTLLCRSLGAVAILFVGMSVAVVADRARSRLPILALVAIVPLYIGVRTTGLWHGEGVLEAAGMISEDRQESFQFRIDQEEMLLERANERPWLGWGGWGANRVTNEEGRDISITDGWWIILLGTNGIVGLVGCFGAMLFPSFLLLVRKSKGEFFSSESAPLLALSLLGVFWAIDSLLNAMYNPIYLLGAGAVIGGLDLPASDSVAPAEPRAATLPKPHLERRLVTGEPSI